MYSGNLGLAHSFDEFLEAARRLRDRPDIVFLFVGDGPRLAEVKAARDREGLDQHPPARLRPARPVARLALAGRRSSDLDAARDDRDRRARQALRRDGRGPAGRLRRPRALRVGRHDPRRRLRHHRHCPATSTAWWRRSCTSPSNPSLARRMGERGRSAFLTAPRTKTLLRPLVRADRRTARSTGNRPPGHAGPARPRRDASRRRGAACHAVSR